jgi:hypothetical protein
MMAVIVFAMRLDMYSTTKEKIIDAGGKLEFVMMVCKPALAAQLAHMQVIPLKLVFVLKSIPC